MSELIKTKAIVLKKLDYGDTSRILHLFTEDFGKISAILKGARSPKSKIGLSADSFNFIQIVLYKKETRDIQLIKDLDLIKHFTHINEDIDRIKFASAIIELLNNLTVENEQHIKLFNGTVRILELMNEVNNSPILLFAKYFLFFVKEIGYEFQINNCSICHNKINPELKVFYSFESGLLCSYCREDRLVNGEISKELFFLLTCLTSKKNNIVNNEKELEKIISLIEKFLKYNVHEFKGLKSLELN